MSPAGSRTDANIGPPKLLLTVAEALMVVPISRSRLFVELRQGHIDSCRLGKARLISAESLRAWVDAQLQADREARLQS